MSSMGSVFSAEVTLPNDFTSATLTSFNENQRSNDIFANKLLATMENVLNTTIDPSPNETSDTLTIFGAFIVFEIIMTALELGLSILAASKLPRWRRNYRNQMLMQLSLARFLKRIVFLFVFLEETHVISSSVALRTFFVSSQIYLDFVVSILVLFFIRHMYETLIIVLVKIKKNNLRRVIFCAWLMPLLVSVGCTSVIVTQLLDEWLVYCLISCLFRWPIILIGTGIYIVILYRVLKGKTRQFARVLTVLTFLLCLVINMYLVLKDIIFLWCLKSFVTSVLSYLLGIVLNILTLALYVILIHLSFRCKKNEASRNIEDNLNTSQPQNVIVTCLTNENKHGLP